MSEPSDPSEALPCIFEWSVGVACHPPSAEEVLGAEQSYAEQETGGDAEMSVHAEPPVVVDEGADDALGDVVGHAHAAVGYYTSQGAACAGAVPQV